MPNVYEKLQSCRVKLQQMNLKKSGKNAFAKYSYYELQDFMNEINQLFEEHKLFSQISFTPETAVLTIFNAEQSEEIIHFTIPMAKAEMKGALEIQQRGAEITYFRRYLYMMALEITESDAVDSSHNPANASERIPQASPSNKASDKQIGLIRFKSSSIAKKHSVSVDDIFNRLGISNINDLSGTQANQIIEKLIQLEGAK